MSTLNGTNLSLLDLAKRTDPNGKIARIVEMLAQTNDVLRDMVWMQGNLPTGHRTTLRTSLPTAYFKLLNQGVAMSKSTSSQITEATGQLQAWSEIDCDLVDMAADKEAFLLSEAQPFLEAMNQKMAQYIFYGNQLTEPEAFTGLAPRYNSLSGITGENIINASGSGSDNASIWFVVWGENTLHGIVPMGSVAGLTQEDKGKVTIETPGGTAAGTRLDVYRHKWDWKCGLALRDWRAVSRIVNIDISNLTAQSSQANLNKLMIKAWHRILRMQKLGRAAIYMDRTVAEMLDIQRYDIMSGSGTGQQNLGGSITWQTIDGQWVPMFRGIPIGIVDQLTEAETAVA